MGDTSEQFGVGFSLSHLLDVLRGFQQIGDAAERSGKRVDRALSGSRSRQRGSIRQNTPALLDNASVNVQPANAPIATNAQGNRLNIIIRLMGADSSSVRNGARAVGNIAGRVSESGYVGKRSKYLPALIKEPSRIMNGPGVHSEFRSSTHQNTSALLDNANVSVQPPDAPITTTARGNRLNIVIRLMGGRSGGAVERIMKGGTREGSRSRELALPGSSLPGISTWLPTGPRQQIAKLWDAMHYAASTGNNAAFDDANDSYGRLRKRLQPKKPRNKIMDAILTTRLNGEHASPLIGRTMAAFGIEAATAGPLALLAGAAVAAKEGLDKASEAANSFAKISALVGSSTATTSRLQALGVSLGLSPGDISGMAGGLQSRITGDPMGRMAGMRLGVYNLPGMFGNQDQGTQLETALRNLKRMGAGSQQTALARELGLDGVLSTINNRHLGRYAQSDEQTRTNVMNPDFVDKSQQYSESVGRLGQAFENLNASMSPQLLDKTASLFNSLATIMDRLANFFEGHQGLTSVLASISGIGQDDDMAKLFAGSSSNDGVTRALNDNTRTTRENTQAMLAPGVYGSGNATRGPAIGDHMSGMAWRQAQDAGGYAQSTY